MRKNIELLLVEAPELALFTSALHSNTTSFSPLLSGALEALQAGQNDGVLIQLDSEALLSCEQCLKHGDLTIYPKSRKVTRKGQELTLTPKEFDILFFLARNCGEVFSKEQIYRAVWETDYPLDESNIMAFIRKLRKKLEPDPDSPVYILTVWGVGYKFNENLPPSC